MLTAFPQCNFSLEFPEILSQNDICYHWLSVWDFQNDAFWDTDKHALLLSLLYIVSQPHSAHVRQNFDMYIMPQALSHEINLNKCSYNFIFKNII